MSYPEYYSARVNLGALAAGVLAGILYAFLALASALFGAFGVLDWGRLIVAVAMVLIAGFVYLLSEKWAGFASISIAICSFIYLMSVPLFVVWARRHGVELRLGFAASMSIGLALHYAVLRMSAAKSIAVAGPASLVGSFLVFKEVDLDTARALVYLVAANVTGSVLCRVLEKKERAMVESRVEVFKIWSRINKLRSDFLEERRKEKVWVAAIAHELSQPLLVARHNVELITKTIDFQSIIAEKELYPTVMHVGDALSEVEFGFNKIINQVRLSTEIVVVRMGWVDIKALIDNAIEAVGVQGEDFLRRLEIIGLSEGVVYTDRFLAVRVIRNIIENAINSAPHYHPKIRLRIDSDSLAGELRIVVINLVSGRSLPSVISKPTSASQRSIGKGLGVGLSIVRNFASALPGHKFSLRVKKGMGARAEFVIQGVFYKSSRSFGDVVRGLNKYRIRLFVETPGLRVVTSSFFAEKGLLIELLEVDQLGYYIKSSLDNIPSSEEEIFIIEIIPRFTSAEFFLGKELHEIMSCRGKYIFLSRGALDSSYNNLGVVIDVLEGDRFLHYSLDSFLSPDLPG